MYYVCTMSYDRIMADSRYASFKKEFGSSGQENTSTMMIFFTKCLALKLVKLNTTRLLPVHVMTITYVNFT